MSNYTNFDVSSSFDSLESLPEVLPHDGFVSQGVKGWYDAFVARVTTFPDGQREILVQREKHFAGAALSAIPKAKRGESENREASEAEAVRRAKKNIRQRCKAIGADRMVTLTYRENVQDRDRALADWKKFVSRIRAGRRHGFHYVAVMEEQKRGSIHFHIACRGRQSYYLLRSVWRSIVGSNESGAPMGNVHVRNPHQFGFGRDGIHKLASYISKYIAKQLDIRGFNEKRYFTSRGIVVPEAVSWRLASSDMLSACQVAFNIALEGKMEGLQMWCNNGLGLVWLSSAPGCIDRGSVLVPF